MVAPRSLKGNRDLYLIDAAAGAVLQPLTTDPAQDSGPILSPDRSSIVYLRIDGTNRELRVMAADGTGTGRCSRPPPPAASHPTGPPGTRSTPTCSQSSASTPQASRTCKSSGSTARCCGCWTLGWNGSTTSPTHRTDGRWLFGARTAGGGVLYLMPDDGSGPAVQLTQETEGAVTDPMFSPDGQEVVFTWASSEGGVNNVDIFVIKSDGTDLRRLTDHPGQDQNPNFSPDGTQIVFKVIGPAPRRWVRRICG